MGTIVLTYKEHQSIQWGWKVNKILVTSI